ncbi:hypothetical protein ACJJTC_008829 [Scirpophaga incertulas]
MLTISVLVIALWLSAANGYHDPDLNYHLNQLQKLPPQPCADNGYSYPTPAVQLTTTGVKVPAAPSVFAQPTLQSYQYPNTVYSPAYTQIRQGIPQNTYLPQPATAYQTSSLVSQSKYVSAAASKEVHGYATSAGLSAVASPVRTVIPQATYAQAPIIAKITAAPLIAKFSASPAKATLITQNQHVAGTSRASLNSFGSVHSGGPVVSQVYAAPSATYTTSQALKVQQPQLFAAARYTSYVTPTQYSQVGPVHVQSAAVGTKFRSYNSNAASTTHYFNPASVTQYISPAVMTHYSAPSQAVASVSQVAPIIQYHTPSLAQYTAPTAAHYATPAISQYATPVAAQHAAISAPVLAQYPTQAATQYTGSVLTQHKTSNIGVVHQSVVPTVNNVAALSTPISANAPAPRLGHAPVAAVKNLHTEFLENYDAHPRYSYEYSVNDPHTGDIKQQKEERDGEVVKGQYSLVEPDGSVRTVEYVADWETGFHADVRNSKDNKH